MTTVKTQTKRFFKALTDFKNAYELIADDKEMPQSAKDLATVTYVFGISCIYMAILSCMVEQTKPQNKVQ
jgi:hypothetical protein